MTKARQRVRRRARAANGARATDLARMLELAAGHHRAGRAREAERGYRRVLDVSRGQVDALSLLGSLLAQQGRFTEATPLLEQATAACPAFTEAQFNLALCYKLADRLQDAIDAYRACLERDPSYADARHGLGNALAAAGRVDEAAEALWEASRLAPDDPAPLNNLGCLLAEAGRGEEAAGALARAAARAPENPDIYLNLSKLHKTEGRMDEALAACALALKIAPDSAAAHLSMGHVLFDRKENERALAAFEQAARLEPENPDALIAKAAALGRLERKDEAHATYRAAAEAAPDHALARFGFGESLYGRGEAAAAAHLRRYLELAPDDAQGAALILALIGDCATPERWPPDHVRTAFDMFAGDFDEHLVEKLSYRAPGLLHDLFRQVAGDHRVDTALDIGCGTGLVGREFRARCVRLDGVDLSAKMIAAAGETGVYDSLDTADLVDAMEARTGAYDLILAGDVFIYIGNIGRSFAAARNALTSGGRLIFSVEEHTGDGYALRASMRYAHAESYLRESIEAAGLSIEAVASGALRRENGQPVAGLIVSARRA